METEQYIKTKKPFYKKWWFIVLAVLIFFRTISSINEITQRAKSESLNQTTNTFFTPEIPTPDTAHFVFDMPNLVDKNLSQLQSLLGAPKGQDPTQQQINLGVSEWDKTFTKNGKNLLVTYSLPDKKIIDFFIETDDPSGITKDTNHLLRLGNLSQNDPKYTIEFISALSKPGFYTGVKIIPN